MKSRVEIRREWFQKKQNELLHLPYAAVKILVDSDHLEKEFAQYYKIYKEDKPALPIRPSPHKTRWI